MWKVQAMLRVLSAASVSSLLMGWPGYVLAQQGEAASTPSTVSNDLAGKTARFLSDRHGSGVVYFAQDGRTFMWNPGQFDVLTGNWSGETIQISQGTPKTLTVIDTITVTFPGSFADRGGIFAILEAKRIHDDLGVEEVSDGDILTLEDGEPPCRMCRVDMTFSQMLGN